MTNIQKTHRSEQGFTLVELAIVMVIIGLLIGGILKGQELIANAKVSATISQLKGLDAAMNTFQDKYNALAGDMLSAQTRLPNGVAADSGNGNGVIDAVAGAAPTAASEGVRAFAQLARADLISGVTPTGAVVFGERLPVVKAAGGMWLGTSAGNGSATGVGANALMGSRIYASLTRTAAAYAAANGAIPVQMMAQVDRKMDDGNPATGGVYTLCGAGGINAGLYVENSGVTCASYVRIMN